MMSKKHKWFAIVAIFICLTGYAWAQQQDDQLPDAPKPQNVPGDSSTATRPLPAPAPGTVTAPPRSDTPPTTQPTPDAPASPSRDATPDTTASSGNVTVPRQMPPVRRTAPGSAPADDPREELYKMTTTVNFVTVPVTVKDGGGRLVEGLVARDFSVYENGVKQNLNYFTSDPFPLSAAVVIDVSMSDTDLKKVQETLSALTGAFSPFDELSIYTYAGTVKKVTDFTAVNDQLASSLRTIRAQRGRNPGVITPSGPMISGPTVNGRPVDPGAPHTPTIPHESMVLNDAILRAALDLARRDQAPHWASMRVRPRKILFVIGEGREDGSNASYQEVLKLLLTNEISVYGVATGDSALPGYRTARKFRIPGVGPANVLAKYAAATGGQVFTEFGREAIESAYGEVTSQARNQYTLGYTTRATGAGAYRSIEVRVKRPNVKVFARDGYYPAPPLAR